MIGISNLFIMNIPQARSSCNDDDSSSSKMVELSKWMVADLNADNLEYLKQLDPAEKSDSKYISYLLKTMFSERELMSGSVSGKQSNFNGVSYQKLDPVRLLAIKGKNTRQVISKLILL